MATPKRSPLSINSTPTLQDVHTIISNLSKPVINVTPVNRLAETRPTPGRQLVGGPKFDPAPVIPEKPFVPKMIPHMPGSTKAMTQTSPTSFQTYDMPIPLQTEYMGQKVGAPQTPQVPQEQAPVIPTKKPQEWYVAMDRRNELVGKLRAENPEKKALQDDELINKYLEVNPQFTEYFKIPEPEQQVSDTMQQDEIVIGIRRDFGEEANKYTDAQLLEMRKQHEQGMQGDAQGPNTALKGMPGAMDDTGVFGIPKLGRFEPTLKWDKEKDYGAPNVGKMYVNIPGSTANVASDVANMGIDFPDVITGLIKISRGTVANTIKNTVGLFVDDNEEKYAIAVDRMKRKGGMLGKIATVLESDEAMADQVRGALGDRYFGADKFAKTLTEDPIGVVADIASIIEGGGTLLKLGGKASGATRLAKIGDELASIGNASDPYALGMQGISKVAGKAVDAVTKPSEPGAVSFTDRIISAYNGLDARTVRSMKDNADYIKGIDDGTINKESMRENVVKIIDDIDAERTEIGRIYQPAYKTHIKFDPQEIVSDIVNKLEEQGVIFDDAGKIVDFDGTNPAMMGLNDSAESAIISSFNKAVKDITRRSELTVQQLHAIRINLNQAIYQISNTKSGKAPGIQKVVDGINVKLKQVPGFAKIDKAYAKIATEMQQVKKYLTTTDAEQKLQMRGTVKSFLSESGKGKLDVVEKYIPGFRRQAEALVAYDDYLTTREKKKVGQYNKPVSGITGGGVGFGIAGPVGGLIGAVAGTMLHSFVTDPKRFKNRVVNRLGNKVAKKVARGEALTGAERAKMDFEAERLLAKPQLALEYKPDLKTEKVQVVDTQGVVKGQPGAQTLQKQAIEDGKIVQEKTINASPIKIPGKTNPNLPKKVVETGQENIKQPTNPYQQKRLAEKQRIADAKKVVQEKKENISNAYQEAKGETIKDVSKFKKGMITPEGKITNTGFNRSRAYYQVEGDGNFTYRYEGEAKPVNQVIVPKKEAPVSKEEVSIDSVDEQSIRSLAPDFAKDFFAERKAGDIPFRTLDQLDTIASEMLDLEEAKLQGKISPKAYNAIIDDQLAQEAIEAQKRMESQIKKEMGDEYNQTKDLVKEIMKIERHEQNLGKVGRNKVKDKNYKVMKEQEFTSKKEKLIEKIAEKNNLTLPEAKDRYDRELERNRDIGERYQMRQEYKQEPKEVQKTMLSPKEAEAKIRKYFNEDEVPVIFEDTITTPRGQEAYGKYHDGAITLVKNPKLDTPDHEALHAYFDMFTTKNRQAKVLAEVKKKQGINNNIDAEERLADGFSEYIAKRGTFTGAVKEFFKDVWNDMKKVFGKEDAVRSLYKDIMTKKRPGRGTLFGEGRSTPIPAFQAKIDKVVVETLIDRIKKAVKSGDSDVSLSLKENNLIKKINPIYSRDKKGGWNGYGYTLLGKHLQVDNFNDVLKNLDSMKKEAVEIKVKEPKTQEAIMNSRAKKLSKLTDITEEQAKIIAQEKLDYKREQIDMMYDRQSENYSRRRETLINKMERENPLRPIKDVDHAEAIVSASRRHKDTNYESLLDEGREKAKRGEIDRAEVKEYARQNISGVPKFQTKDTISIRGIEGEKYGNYIIDKGGAGNGVSIFTKGGSYKADFQSVEEAKKYIDGIGKKTEYIEEVKKIATNSKNLEDYIEKVSIELGKNKSMDKAVNSYALKKMKQNKNYDYVQALTDIYYSVKK